MKLLFVDAGNYCRSPVAEIVARTLAGAAGLADKYQFGSAGLKDKHVGDHADPRSIEVCAQRGYDLTAFRCREITNEDFRAYDVVLAMDRDNLLQLQSRRPADAATDLRLFLGAGEVPDPYYGGVEGFAMMMHQIETGVRRLLGITS